MSSKILHVKTLRVRVNLHEKIKSRVTILASTFCVIKSKLLRVNYYEQIITRKFTRGNYHVEIMKGKLLCSTRKYTKRGYLLVKGLANSVAATETYLFSALHETENMNLRTIGICQTFKV